MHVLLLLLFCASLCVIAAIAYRREPAPSWLNHPAIYASGLLTAFGALGYFGLTEMAGRYGLSALLGFFAVSILFLFGPLVMRPLRWASHTRRLSTPADLFSYRYRGTAIARLVTTTLLISSLPFAAAQVQTAAHLLQPTPVSTAGVTTPFFPAMLFCLLVWLFLWWLCQRNAGTQTLRLTLAVASLIACVTLAVVCLVSVNQQFGGFAQLNEWVVRRGQNEIVHRFEYAYGLVTLFFAAGLTLPHLYYQQSRTNPASKSAAMATWLFPLLLFVCTLTMFPLLWGGLAAQLNVPLQYYLLELSRSYSPWLHQGVALGGLFICAAAIILVTLSLSKMAMRYFINPLQPGNPDLYKRQTRLHYQFNLVWLVLVLLTSYVLESTSITNLTLVSFIGTVQLAPGILAALYVPILNRRGVAAGLVCGLTLWFIGLYIPLFTGEWHYPVVEDVFNIHFGVTRWSNWLLASLTANFGISLVVSRLTNPDTDEKYYARACMVDSVSAPQRVEPSECQLDTLEERLSQHLGTIAAKNELRKALDELQISGNVLRPFEWRTLRQKLADNLHDLIGVNTGDGVIDTVMPVSSGTLSYLQDPHSIELLLADRRQELRGIAAELNKLRLHHRQTLQGLPLGACAVDSNGEILLWNQALETLTGVSAQLADGSHIRTLPSPWNDVMTEAASSDTPHHHAIQVNFQGRNIWFNLHKAAVPYGDPASSEQVILLEDVTESLQLTRQVAHTERLASIGRLAAGVAHEIGNPVTGIACLAQDIHRDCQDAEQQKSAALILTQTDRITRIVRSMIDFSRSGTESEIRLQAVSIGDTLRHAEQLLSLQKDKRQVNYRVEAGENLTARGDPHQLIQVFLNLMSNARDASNDGDDVDVVAVAADNKIKITITDRGSGIAPNMIDKVMEPFFTTKDTGEGTGLGLSLSYSMVRSYGGDIELNSPLQDGRGTRVTVWLPTDNRPAQDG